MQKKPLVSVIVPVYNVEKHLSKCLQSILQQTYTNLEIILIDDGSTDTSGSLCDIYALKDRRIQTFHQKNAGLSSARNKGLDVCHGEYIAFVDSDDYIGQTMYETLVQLSQEHTADMVVCNLAVVYPNGKIKEIPPVQNHCTLIPLEYALAYGVNEMSFGSFACNKLYKRELFSLNRYREGIYYEDFEASMRIFPQATHILYTPQVFYYYVNNPLGITHTRKFKSKIDDFNISKEFIAFCKKKNFSMALQRAKSRLLRESINLIFIILLSQNHLRYKQILEEASSLIAKNILMLVFSNLKLGQKSFALLYILFPKSIAWLLQIKKVNSFLIQKFKIIY